MGAGTDARAARQIAALALVSRVLDGEASKAEARTVAAAAEARGLPTSAPGSSIARAVLSYVAEEGSPLCWACLESEAEHGAGALCSSCLATLDGNGWQRFPDLPGAPL